MAYASKGGLSSLKSSYEKARDRFVLGNVMPSNAYGTAKRLLISELKKLGAASSTFYVRDPDWDEEFRLVFMPGVKVVEPMHGFLFPRAVRKRFFSGGAKKYVTYAGRRRAAVTPSSSTVARLARENPLFGDFAQREGVVSCARLIHSDSRGPECVLCVNFDHAVRFTNRLKGQLDRLLRKLAPQASSIVRQLERRSRLSTFQIIRILRPIQSLASMGQRLSAPRLQDHLRQILRAALRAFDVAPEDGLATIYEYNRNSAELKRVAWVSEMIDPVPVQDVSRGDGVMSWVALKRRALLIEDLEKSRFGEIYRELSPQIRSELAVPMMAQDRLIGVLNLESVKARVFPPESVRLVWHAANQAAVAFRLSEEAERSRRFADQTAELLKISHEAVTGESTGTSLLERLANITKDHLRADDCDIWLYDPRNDSFQSSGASYSRGRSAQLPRADGWSHFVQQSGIPVWIEDISDTTSYTALYWSESSNKWIAKPGSRKTPNAINTRLLQQRARCEVGVPIPVRGNNVGVAWVKFRKDRDRPSRETMGLAKGFAGEIGLVIDCFQHEKEREKMRADAVIEADVQKSLFPVGSIKLSGIDAYVSNQPYESKIGGDFHALVNLDDTSVGVLLGDAMSHGIQGALRMLPLVATFRAFCGESRSTKHIMEKLRNVAYELHSHGTALYAIISKIRDQRWLFGSAAGHSPLIVVKRDENLAFPDIDSPAHCGWLGVERASSLGEDKLPLSVGDLIVGYTDGIEESGIRERRGPQNKFGRNGVLAAVLREIDGTPQAIAKSIRRDAKKAAGGCLEDDATVIVIRITDDDSDGKNATA